MAATAPRPLSQVLPDQLDESLPSSFSYRKRVRSHYRPFSTLYTAPPYLEFEAEEEKPPSSRFLKRASSIAGFQALQTMAFGFNFKPKKDSPQLGTSNDAKPSKAKSKSDATRRPSTANGTLRPPHSPFHHRLKTKRSTNAIMTSPDATASSVSLGTVTPPSRPVLGLPPRAEDPLRPSTANGKAVKFKGPQHDEDPSSSKTFKPMSHWQERHNMKFHPYGEDATYMQAYDPVLLESVRFSDQLLQRLTRGSPSFYDYGKIPPATVLDLGCGEGHWVLHAASAWKESIITGFDLVDITLPALETTENVRFVQGNFVKYRLPFEDKSFEFVRMANLTLCIPYLQWVAVLAEARRVLTGNGRLEIIDDQMMFPYVQSTPVPKDGITPRQESKYSLSDSDDYSSEDDLDSDTLQGEENGSGESLTLYDSSRPSSFEDSPLANPLLSASETIRPFHSHSRAPRYYARPPRPVITDPHFIQQSDEIWERKRERCQELETLFLSMLRDPEERHEVALKPHEFMTSFLGYIFGNNNAREKDSFFINLAEWNSPLAMSDETVEDVETKEPALAHFTDPSFVGRKKWIDRLDWEKRRLKRKGGVGGMGLSEMERAELTLESPIPAVVQPKAAKQLGLPSYAFTPSTSPDANGTTPLKHRKNKTPSPPLLFAPTPQRIVAASAKAAGIFGVSYSALTAATAQATVAQRRGIKPLGMVQSPGLLIQSTEGSEYVRMDPVELEMHACRWIHTLLGCRQALGQYVTKFLDEKGGRLVDDEMFGHYLSEYEGFSRLRFGWPAGGGEKDETELLIDALQQSPTQPWNTAQSQPDKPLHVRSVRVYHAVKADDTPMRETPLLRGSTTYA